MSEVMDVLDVSTDHRFGQIQDSGIEELERSIRLSLEEIESLREDVAGQIQLLSVMHYDLAEERARLRALKGE